MKRMRCDAGSTFNEVLVSIGLVVVVILGYSLGSIGVIRQQRVTDNSTVALHLAQDKLEELQASKSFDDINLCPNGGEHAIGPKLGVAGVFDRCWRILPSPLGTRLKQIEVKVSWRDLQEHDITLSTLKFFGE